MRYLSLLALAALLVFTGCRKEKEDPVPPGGGGGGGGVSCNSNFLPIVMCHGTLASGDTYAKQAQRFAQNAQCADRIYMYDWNSLGGGGNSPALLDAFIDDVLQRTGATQVELVGHSAGGGLGYSYLSDAGRAAKVAHYVHIGASAQSGPAGPGGSVPTLNIWSPDDAVVAGADIPGAVNVSLAGLDHYQVATAPSAFAAMFEFFRGVPPTSTEVQPDGRRNVEGRAVTLGENQPLAGATVNVWRVDAATGFRAAAQPDHTFTTDAQGKWGGFQAVDGAYYEFEVLPTTGRKLHYYREPFKATDRFVYLRGLPPAGSLAGTLLASLPSNDAQAVVINFTANQAVISGRDQLTVNGVDLATAQLAPASKTAIAFFLYDANNDAVSNGTPVALFSSLPFLAAADQFFQAATPASIELAFAGRSMRVRNWPSASEGLTIAVFE